MDNADCFMFGLVAGFIVGVILAMTQGVPMLTEQKLRYEHVLRVTGYDDSRDVVVSIDGERVVILDPTQPKEAQP